MENYLCERCGYKTERISNFKNHLNRKFICMINDVEYRLFG